MQLLIHGLRYDRIIIPGELQRNQSNPVIIYLLYEIFTPYRTVPDNFNDTRDYYRPETCG